MSRVFIHRRAEGLTPAQEVHRHRQLYGTQRITAAEKRSLKPDDGKTTYHFCYGESTASAPKIHTTRLSPDEIDAVVSEMAEYGYVLCDYDGSNRQI